MSDGKQETLNNIQPVKDNHSVAVDITGAIPKTKRAANPARWFKKIRPLFGLCVVIPTAIAILYFGLIASDVYISESKFIVRSHNNQSGLSGVGALLQTTGLVRSQDDSYTVNAYITSRDAMSKLNNSFDLVKTYSKSNIDLLSRFNPFGFDGSHEALFEYLQKRVSVDVDAVSMISTLKIKAYSPEDAYSLNESLLDMSEALVNQLNDRARADTIGFSDKLVEEAQIKIKQTSENLNQFRLKNSIYNLDRQTEAQLQLISKLQDALISVKTQLSQVKTVTGGNPQIIALKAREQSLQAEIDLQIEKIFGPQTNTITSNTAEYEYLMLEHKVAEQQLVSAMTSLEHAKDEAQRKLLYLERIAQPHKPDAPLEPNRLLNIIATLVIGLLLYGVLSLFIVSVKEHRD